MIAEIEERSHTAPDHLQNHPGLATEYPRPVAGSAGIPAGGRDGSPLCADVFAVLRAGYKIRHRPITPGRMARRLWTAHPAISRATDLASGHSARHSPGHVPGGALRTGESGGSGTRRVGMRHGRHLRCVYRCILPPAMLCHPFTGRDSLLGSRQWRRRGLSPGDVGESAGKGALCEIRIRDMLSLLVSRITRLFIPPESGSSGSTTSR